MRDDDQFSSHDEDPSNFGPRFNWQGVLRTRGTAGALWDANGPSQSLHVLRHSAVIIHSPNLHQPPWGVVLYVAGSVEDPRRCR